MGRYRLYSAVYRLTGELIGRMATTDMLTSVLTRGTMDVRS